MQELEINNLRPYYFGSWRSSVPEFATVLANLRDGKLREDDTHRLINVSSGKYVWRCQVGGFDFAYKTQQGKTPWRYLLRPSLPVRECRHYQFLAELGIPTAKVLAVGETRCFCLLRESFLVTAFLDGTRDGRCFMTGGEFRTGHEELCRQFCREHLRLLAVLHEHRWFHKAFHPRNLLFRQDADGKLEQCYWIDVARLRPVTPRQMERAVLVDLHTFFRDMQLPRKQVEELVQFYVSCRQSPVAAASTLVQEMVEFKRRLFSSKKYRLFAEGE
jgi:tRNA A-37 threonylcarbamoyl transferase component Bud32